MLRGKFSKIMSVALSASLLLGSLPLWGGGKVEAADAYKVDPTGSKLIQGVEFGTVAISKERNYIAWGHSLEHGYDITFADSLKPSGVGMIPDKINLMAIDSSVNYAQDEFGSIYTWGNRWSDLTDGSSSVDSYPVFFSALSNVDGIDSAARSAAATKDGDVYVWGMNNNNILGVLGKQATPVKLELPEKAKKIGLTTGSLAVLLESGSLGYMNRDGSGFVPAKENIIDFWIEGTLGVALDENHKMHYWKSNVYMNDFVEFTNTPDDIKQISVGYDHVLVLRETGDIMSFGNNDRQQLGTSAPTIPAGVLQISNRAPKNPVYVSAAYKNSFVVTSDDKTYGWGFNDRGNVGVGTQNTQFGSTIGTPTVIPELNSYVQVPPITPAKPATPANFKVTTEETSLTASWDSVDGATGYKVTVGGQEVYSGQGLAYTYTGLTADTDYTVDVVAVNSGGESAKASLTVKTKAVGKLPAPINFGINVVNKNSLVTSWNPVVGAETYTLVINGEIAYTGPATTTSKVFFDLLPNTTYVVEVYASKDGVDGERATDVATTPEAEAKLEVPGTPTVDSTEEGNVKISWNATSGALLYKVFRNGIEVGSVSSPSYTDKTAVEGQAYLYTVKAFDGSKTSEASPFVLVTVTEKVETPKAPDNPRNFRLVSDEHSVTASWDAVVGADTYQVIINGLEVYNGPELSYTYTGLPEKTEYRVEIAAINSVGKSGTQLDTIWTKDPLKLPAAKNPRAVTTHNEAVISWDAVEGATSYWVRINNDIVYEGSDTTVTAKGLGSDRPYTVYIFAKNDTVEGEPASLHIVMKKEPVVLEVPANLVATPKATYIKLTWNAVAGATEYIVKQGQSIVYQGPLTVFTDVQLESGVTYDYTVVASNGADKSEEATVSATTLVEQLPYPTNLRITNLEWNKVSIDWDEVDGADEYLITRDGMTIGIPQNTGWSEGPDSIRPGATYTYKVAAYKNGVLGKTALKVVTVPTEPEVGIAPVGDLVVKANRVEHNRVGLSWTTVTGATYYDVYQDNDNKVYSGQLNTITDPNVGPEETHTYKVVAGNEWGTLDSNVISITTPAAPQSIVITPSDNLEGTITFDFKTIEGAVTYVERNPQTTYTPMGDGTYHRTYYNAATGETRDEGIVFPTNGKLTFTEAGIDPGKNYHYDIVAVIKKADGSEEVVAKEEVSVTAPADGSGVTVPGTTTPPTDPTDPANGGGTTDPGTGGTTPPSTGGGSTGGSTGGSGSSTGGSTTTPTTDGKDSVPGTVVVPGAEGEESEGDKDAEVEDNTNFSDISGNFAEDAIKHLTATGILKGYTDGTFGPNKKITRAEFAIMTLRALGYQNSGTYVQEFKDFNENAWYAEELLTALDAGITKGFTDGTYRPNVFIPREQAAVMIANILEKNNFQADVSKKIFMDDTAIIAWANSSVYLLKSHKIVEGQNNFFYPKREITRAEAAVMIYRLLNVLNQ